MLLVSLTNSYNILVDWSNPKKKWVFNEN